MLAYVFMVLPFSYFFYEESDDEISTKSVRRVNWYKQIIGNTKNSELCTGLRVIRKLFCTLDLWYIQCVHMLYLSENELVVWYSRWLV